MRGNDAGSRYTSNGKRLSSMTHARHPHYMSCGRVVYGNGGYASHRKAHGCRPLTPDQWRALRAEGTSR